MAGITKMLASVARSSTAAAAAPTAGAAALPMGWPVEPAAARPAKPDSAMPPSYAPAPSVAAIGAAARRVACNAAAGDGISGAATVQP